MHAHNVDKFIFADVLVASQILEGDVDMANSIAQVLLGLLLTALAVEAFYLPGLAPTNFCTAKVQKSVGKMKCKV